MTRATRNWVAAASALVLIATLGPSCAIDRQREQIRTGLLTQGLHRQAFLAEWGLPTKTSTLSGDDTTRVGWADGAGFFFKGRAIYDVWEYRDREVTLVFERMRLVTW